MKCLQRAGCWMLIAGPVMSGVALVLAISTPTYAQEYTITDLGHRGEYMSPTAINRSGVIVGYIQTVDAKLEAFVWRDGVFTVLPKFVDIASPPGNAYFMVATDINSKGQVVGDATAGTETFAFVYERGEATFFRFSDAEGYSSASAINDKGLVPGLR